MLVTLLFVVRTLDLGPRICKSACILPTSCPSVRMCDRRCISSTIFVYAFAINIFFSVPVFRYASMAWLYVYMYINRSALQKEIDGRACPYRLDELVYVIC